MCAFINSFRGMFQLMDNVFVYVYSIPFTIQRLCELLIDPKKNYTGTDKFLRGIEKVTKKREIDFNFDTNYLTHKHPLLTIPPSPK